MARPVLPLVRTTRPSLVKVKDGVDSSGAKALELSTPLLGDGGPTSDGGGARI